MPGAGNVSASRIANLAYTGVGKRWRLPGLNPGHGSSKRGFLDRWKSLKLSRAPMRSLPVPQSR
ncbi:hypothetical protein NITHO_3060006 [Nitrolancea hollandica Lb]|uniref:Uncharacterized protein n=1 Tax=Nitrolancea hollandica Lb TaxID=1129897 RepID=I4EHB1_9BACT|nr:hypothetical protein NITHO_3060006 [Nitrolancea hollandica Lb]